jgi:hypothetical protein
MKWLMTYQVVRYMNLAMDPIPGEESAVDDLAMQLLRTMGYASRAFHRDLDSRKDISLLIYGEWKHTKTDVCIINRDEILVQEDKRHKKPGDSRPQVIAEAIAVQVHRRAGLAELDFKIPGSS